MSKVTEPPESSSAADEPSKEDDPSSSTTTNTTEAKNDTPSAVKKEATKTEPAKKKYTDWPLKNVADPHDHDVLYGRGGGTNHHPGNKRYRKMVEDRKVDYVNSKRLDKPLVALEIIKVWRNQEPPGRFLKLDEKTGLWNDVGDKKAREKTSQALREKAPQIRKQQEEERVGTEGPEKSTRFAEGTKDGRAMIKRPGLARDTSLGPLAADNVEIGGFSWQEGIGDGAEGKSAEPTTHMPPPGGPPPPTYSGTYSPHAPPPHHPHGHYRMGSHGSVGSMGPPVPYPPPGPYIPTASDDRRMQFADQQRYGSWSSIPPPMPPTHIQSGGSWGAPEHGMAREHSLGNYPLPHASVGHPASYGVFHGREASGHYGPPPPHYSPHGPPPPHYGPPPYHYSSGGIPPPTTSPGPYRTPPPPPAYGGPPGHTRTPSNLSVDPKVASAWAGTPQAEIEKTLSGDKEDSSRDERGNSTDQPRLSKPDIIKRATSNQNETPETKPDRVGPSIKRAALNRDSSRAANRLKEICFPDQFKNGKFDAAQEVSELASDMDRHTLNSETPERALVSDDDRKTTLDYLPPISDEDGPLTDLLKDSGRVASVDLVAMDLAIKPKSLEATGRSSTIEGLALDAVDDILKPGMAERTTTMDLVMADLEKPGAIGMGDRLTTTDFLDMVNAPIADDDPAIFSKRQEV